MLQLFSCVFFDDQLTYTSNDDILSDASVDHTSQVRISVMLLMPIVEYYKLRNLDSVKCHDVQTKFNPLLSAGCRD